jgi:catechol 2,3-dioxygenase-like lactoylglutathione lyase family enzyme
MASAPTRPLVQIIGLDHVVFRCRDAERALDFYTNVLGLEAERVGEWRRGEVPFPSVRITPTTIIDLFPFPPDQVAPADGARNVDHVCLVIAPADLDALAGEFPDAQRADGLFGAQGYASSLYIRDPEGNTVELRSYT